MVMDTLHLSGSAEKVGQLTTLKRGCPMRHADLALHCACRGKHNKTQNCRDPMFTTDTFHCCDYSLFSRLFLVLSLIMTVINTCFATMSLLVATAVPSAVIRPVAKNMLPNCKPRGCDWRSRRASQPYPLHPCSYAEPENAIERRSGVGVMRG